MFSVGDGAPSEKRKARYCVGPGAAAYDWKCPSRARSEPPPAHYVVHCGAVWCCVVLCGALWCRVVLYGAGTNVIVSEIASFYAPVCAVESAGFLQELIVKFFEDYCLQN